MKTLKKAKKNWGDLTEKQKNALYEKGMARMKKDLAPIIPQMKKMWEIAKKRALNDFE